MRRMSIGKWTVVLPVMSVTCQGVSLTDGGKDYALLIGTEYNIRFKIRATRSANPKIMWKRTIHTNILGTVGKTPIVRLNKLLPLEAQQRGIGLFGKCEFFNPLGSVKDRLALGIIEDAEKSGKLKPGMTVVEATSGNTGISLAMVCAEKGYPLVVVMAESFSIERRKIMRALGAKVILTPATARGSGMVKKAESLSKVHGWFLPRQFENEANAAYHAKTTGPEIVEEFQKEGLSLDYWVTGYGTGGTFQGAGKIIKQSFPKSKIILAEPALAPLAQSGKTQSRRSDGSPEGSHESWTSHPIQGWTPDFIPLVAQIGLDMGLHDKVVSVESEQAIRTSQRLAKETGVFVGISAGATMQAALGMVDQVPNNSNLLVMLPDTAERYMSTPLFANIQEGMNEEELSIFHSDS